jgi:PAS domain S-box-containing protein
MYGVEGDSYWEGIGVPLKSSDGSVFGAIAIARNVSERLRIEHTWNLLASIVESTEDAIYGMAFGGTILTWNLGAEKIYGYSASELVGTSIFKILPIEERDKLLQIIDKVIRKQQIERFESIRIRKDGKRIFVSVNICPFVDATGKKIGVSAIDRDITESKLAEDTLRNSESRFRTLFSTAPDGIVLMDVSGSILEINPAITTLYEYHRDELLGKSFLKFIKPNDIEKIQLQIHSILHKYDIRINNEATIITSSGKSIPVGISMASLRNENLQPTGLIAIVRDVSIRKQYENELKSSSEQLRNLTLHLQTAREDEKKRIAFEIHDELGYALTALKLDLAWIGKKLKIKEEPFLRKLKEMSELIETTIKKVRTISTQLRPSILDHFGLIAAIEWQAGDFQKRTAVRCKVSIDSKELKFDDPHATAIFRIFQEALTNVARHAKATRVDVSLVHDKNEIVLKVADNGIGIDKNLMQNYKSLGLLGIQERTDFLGGTVEILGEKGLGTTITLRIPVPKEVNVYD